MASLIPGAILQPNGVFTPVGYDPCRHQEYLSEEQQCKALKEELVLELRRSSFAEIVELFETRGADFFAKMTFSDPWSNVGNRGKSILENALQEMKYNLPEQTVLFLIKYYTRHSEQARNKNMNPVHVLVRNCGRYDETPVKLLKEMVETKPEMLRDRMTLGDPDLDMNPVEMALLDSFNEPLMTFMVEKFCGKFDITPEEREKLLSCVDWLNGSPFTEATGQSIAELVNKKCRPTEEAELA